ncbi:hypothetical protein Kpho02_63770 [Kitasatospora phosalacinea]|uniref:Uncharacterized protein n=1 Tax=Kitasatospora phosalacinea TaxID=2065 RepID=A0A9W6QFG6_9ACTN|nr:hypothetical protein Kpho02_63770 [Kitasatospora phosalacinea]
MGAGEDCAIHAGERHDGRIGDRVGAAVGAGRGHVRNAGDPARRVTRPGRRPPYRAVESRGETAGARGRPITEVPGEVERGQPVASTAEKTTIEPEPDVSTW